MTKETQAKGEPMVNDVDLRHGNEQNGYCRLSPQEVRDLYEAELFRLRAERDELVGALEDAPGVRSHTDDGVPIIYERSYNLLEPDFQSMNFALDVERPVSCLPSQSKTAGMAPAVQFVEILRQSDHGRD